MIITLTPNPAVDQTIIVESLKIGDLNRFHTSYLDPAGKGINASRMAHRLGYPTIAFGFLGGEIGELVERALDAERVEHHFVPVAGQTRLNVNIYDENTGSVTQCYGPGVPVECEAWQRLNDLLQFWLEAGRVLVLAGSLPPGIPEDAYATHIRLARAKGVRTILDADGEALRRGVTAQPHLVKPNIPEAERLLGRKLPNLRAVLDGAREIAGWGVSVVVISMGPEGAVCVQGNEAWRAVPPVVERKSTVGSGDSMVAGLAIALARGDPLLDGLRLGTAAGAATAMTPGTELATGELVAALLPQVRIEDVR